MRKLLLLNVCLIKEWKKNGAQAEKWQRRVKREAIGGIVLHKWSCSFPMGCILEPIHIFSVLTESFWLQFQDLYDLHKLFHPVTGKTHIYKFFWKSGRWQSSNAHKTFTIHPPFFSLCNISSCSGSWGAVVWPPVIAVRGGVYLWQVVKLHYMEINLFLVTDASASGLFSFPHLVFMP